MRTKSLIGIGALAVAGIVAAACGGDGGVMDGTGGNTPSGGTTGSGAASSTGGNTTTGGTTGTGGVGTGGASGGGAGEGGLGGMGGVCTSELPTFQVQARSDTAEDWDDNDFDDVEIALECPNALVTATWPHEPDFEDDDPAEANSEITQFTLEVLTDQDLTGKQLNLSIRLVDDGRGPDATNGGYDVYIGATDADYTEVATDFDAGETGELMNANQSDTVTFVIPDDNVDFDPTDLYKIFIRVTNKYWGDGSDPVFDYESAVFEISEFTVTDAP